MPKYKTSFVGLKFKINSFDINSNQSASIYNTDSLCSSTNLNGNNNLSTNELQNLLIKQK